MSINACAELLRRGDPDRFLAVMAAPPQARAVLFPIFAFNLEVARAPWVTAEPMIAEMRLQFWRDVAEEIGQRKKPRAHEVALPLAEAVQPNDAELMDELIAARRWDIYKDAFEDEAHFERYIHATSGNLIWLAAHNLGAGPEAEGVIRALAFAGGIANFLRAVPKLEEHGRIPLLDGRAEAVGDLASKALAAFKAAKKQQSQIARAARPALYTLWRSEPALSRAARAPLSVAEAALDESELSRRGRLLLTSLKSRL